MTVVLMLLSYSDPPACAVGYYKPANHSGGCSPCPANSITRGEGSVQCLCLQGFSRLPTDPERLGCTGQERCTDTCPTLRLTP